MRGAPSLPSHPSPSRPGRPGAEAGRRGPWGGRAGIPGRWPVLPESPRLSWCCPWVSRRLGRQNLPVLFPWSRESTFGWEEIQAVLAARDSRHRPGLWLGLRWTGVGTPRGQVTPHPWEPPGLRLGTRQGCCEARRPRPSLRPRWWRRLRVLTPALPRLLAPSSGAGVTPWAAPAAPCASRPSEGDRRWRLTLEEAHTLEGQNQTPGAVGRGARAVSVTPSPGPPPGHPIPSVLPSLRAAGNET